jgi:hypothetical protein
MGSATVHGRYYVIVTIDVDNNTNTGYGLHEGGYFPTSYGYDMNMEFEFYDGHPNKGNYLNHGATNDAQLAAAFQDQMNGIVRVLPGTYAKYSEWVWYDSPSGPNSGTNNLPPPDDYASIRFVRDRGPSYQGIIRIALSPDGHQAEMVAPFRGFMRDATQPHTAAKPIISLGKTIDISFSLEASGELAPGGQWASNTAEPIRGLLPESADASDRPRRFGRRAAVLGPRGRGYAASTNIQPGEPGLAGGARIRGYESSDVARRHGQHLLPVGAIGPEPGLCRRELMEDFTTVQLSNGMVLSLRMAKQMGLVPPDAMPG